jgi:hypothetical protein
MSEEPLSPVPFEPRKACWAAVLISWLFSGESACVIGPTIFMSIVAAVSGLLSVTFGIGLAGVAAIAMLLVLSLDPDRNYREDDAQAHADPPELRPILAKMREWNRPDN